MISLHSTTISNKAIDLALKTLRSTFVSAGPRAQEFEEALTKRFTLPSAITVNSGTTALHLALIAAGVQHGDEVILPAQTFIATGLSILYCGAKPIFVDINPLTGNIDPSLIRSRISPKTKAILPVHWAGYPCDMDEINLIATEHQLKVVEDAAHALGATYKGQFIGTISDFTAFSFQAIKHLTTGDGGLISTKHQDSFDLLKKLRWFGIDRDKDLPSILGEREYDADRVGFKYHLNDLAAAIGLGNLETFDKKLCRIREIANRYTVNLAQLSGIKLPIQQPDRQSAFWLFLLFPERRSDFIRKLRSFGIPCSVIHIGIDKNKIFGGKDSSLEHQRWFDDHQIHIPLHDELTDENVEAIISCIKSGW